MDLLKDRYKVRGSRNKIKATLRSAAGGTVMATINDQTRFLSHDPIRHAPIHKLPWPLSLIQPFKVEFMRMQNDKIVEKIIFLRKDLDSAINLLLDGISEDDTILISPH